MLEEPSWQAGQLIALQPQAGQLAQPRQIGDFNARNPVATQLSAMKNKNKYIQDFPSQEKLFIKSSLNFWMFSSVM